MPPSRQKASLALSLALAVTAAPLAATAVSDSEAAAEPAGSSAAVRVFGENRYGTAAKVADRWNSGSDVVYVVNGATFPDALTASAAAGHGGSAVLLTRTGAVPPETVTALKELRPKRIVVVGGQASVSDSVVAFLRGHATSGTVTRVAGSNRYATAAAVSAQYGTVDTVYLASGERFPDALAGAPLAGHEGVPLLLTRGSSLPSATRSALTKLRPKRVVVLGGTATVTRAVAKAAAGYTSTGRYERIYGADRYQTAAKIAARFEGTSSPTVVVASGTDFPDALVGGAAAGTASVPVVLTHPGHLPASAASALTTLGKEQSFVLGGRSSVSDAVLTDLRDLLGDGGPGGLPDRIFKESSFWYQKLPNSTPTDPRSDTMVPWLYQVGVEAWGSKDRNLPSMTINTHAYTPTIYATNASDPLVTVGWNNCWGQPAPNPGLLQQFTNVRIPTDAVAGGGSDGHMALYDTTTGRYTDLWLAKKSGGKWTACWGGSIDDASSNPGYFPAPYGATASGLPMEAGAIKADELAAGQINHALALSVPVKAVNKTISWPAQRTDGQSTKSLALSEGQRLRLPASLQLDSLNLNPTTLAVAEAAQDYGIVVIDRSGAFTFHAESPLAMDSNPYPELFGGLENYSVLWGNPHKGEDPFPFAELEVLPVNYGKP